MVYKTCVRFRTLPQSPSVCPTLSLFLYPTVTVHTGYVPARRSLLYPRCHLTQKHCRPRRVPQRQRLLPLATYHRRGLGCARHAPSSAFRPRTKLTVRQPNAASSDSPCLLVTKVSVPKLCSPGAANSSAQHKGTLEAYRDADLREPSRISPWE
jgi:hypothetical protein